MEMNKKSLLYFLFFLVVGVFFRFILILPTFHGLKYDMEEYARYASLIIDGYQPIDCCDKTMGYPFFLAGIFTLFGSEKMEYIFFAQVLIDIVSAVMVFLVSRRIFSAPVAWFSYCLYLLNPFISSYTPLMMNETLTVFFILSFLYLLSDQKFFSRWWMWMGGGMILALLTFTKQAYYAVMMALPLLLMWSVSRWDKRILFVALMYIGILVGSGYSLWRNLTGYHVISIVPPYKRTYGNLYITFYRDGPVELTTHNKIPPMFLAVMNESYGMQYGTWWLYEEKYKKLFWEKFSDEWPLFFQRYVQNLFYIWDKDHLGTLVDSWYPYDRWPLRVLNGVLLSFAGIGIVSYIREKKSHIWHPVVIYSIVLFLHITLLFPLVSNESRHAIPYYGLLCLWAGYGWFRIPLEKPFSL